MAKQDINLGTAPSGLDGDDARTAFTKVNENFTELYDGSVSQPANPKLSAIAASVWAANQLMYATGPDAVALTPLTGAGRALLDDADAPAQRTTLGLGGQILQALQALTMTANGVPYMASASTMAVQASTAFGRGLWNVADQAAAQAAINALGVGQFGFGAVGGSPNVPQADLDSATLANGIYRVDVAGTAFRGLAIGAYAVWTNRLNNTTAAVQIAINYTTGSMFSRTNSTLDFTPVLKAGDYGIGGLMPLVSPNNADSVTATGFYITNGTTPGTPGTAEGLPANAQGYLCHYQNLNPLYAVQEWFLVAAGSDRYTRSKHNGNWGAWNRVQYAATAVTTFGDQEIAGTKTLTGAQLRFKGGTPGMWMEEGGTATGIWMVLNGGTMQFQHRATGFGGTAGLTPLAMNINTQTTRSGYQLTPAVDNSAAMQLGASNYRWPVVYAATGTINTSDAREKTPVAAMSASEIAAAKELSREIGTYKWLQAVAEKGDEARVHIGMTVQRAMEIMAGHGLDPMAYGFVCYDQWEAVEEVAITERYGKLYSLNKVTGEKEYAPDDRDVQEWEASPGTGIHWEFRYESVNTITPGSPAGDRYSFRYDELNMFIAAGIEARLSALEDAA